MNPNIDHIRKYEKEYHDTLYYSKELGEKGTWLSSPISEVIKLVDNFSDKCIEVLDIGCGVGRHTIPIAKSIQDFGGFVKGIDLLKSAGEKLTVNKKKYGINANSILFEKTSVEDYYINQEGFDYIIAISCLEHISSLNNLKDVLSKMVNGTKKGGINYIVMGVDNELINTIDSTYSRPMVETNLKLEEAKKIFDLYYLNWEILSFSIKPWESTQIHTENSLLQKGNTIRLAYKKR